MNVSNLISMQWVMGLRQSLRGKLITWFVIVGVLPLLSIGVLSYWQASNSLYNKVGNELAEVAFNASDKLDRNLFERYGDVQAYAKSDPARSMDVERLTLWADTMMVTYAPVYKLMVITDAQGRIVAVNSVDEAGRPVQSTNLIGLDVSNNEWYRLASSGRLADGETYVEDLHADELMARVYGSGEKSYAMSFTAPIYDEQRRIVGVWTNRFNWQVALDIIKESAGNAAVRGEQMVLHVINHEGKVLASDNPADTLVQDIRQAPVAVNALQENARGFEEGLSFDLERPGVAQLFGYYRSKGYSSYRGLGWATIVAQDRTSALREAAVFGWNTLIFSLITAAVLAALAFYIATSIVQPIKLVVEQLRALASGGADLTQRLPTYSQDEVGQLARAFNAFMETQAGIVRRMIDNSTKLSSGATEISAASNQMSAGAESQTQQVIRTSSAMEEMSSSIREVARNAQATAHATDAAVTHARQGSTRVQAAVAGLNQANQSLQQLRQRSAEIDQVVKLIADIAAQTNILALNAAIEAAGAGVAGARFDVVAEEIRKLAGRTAESTTRISGTVAEIQADMQAAAERMAETAAQAEEVGVSLSDIVEGIASVNDMVTVISSSTTQQARAAEQVAESLQVITQVSQQTAMAARETARTIDDLSGLAQDLSHTAGRFKV